MCVAEDIHLSRSKQRQWQQNEIFASSWDAPAAMCDTTISTWNALVPLNLGCTSWRPHERRFRERRRLRRKNLNSWRFKKTQTLHDGLEKWNDKVRRHGCQEGDRRNAKVLDVKVKLNVLEMLIQTDISDYLAWEAYTPYKP